MPEINRERGREGGGCTKIESKRKRRGDQDKYVDVICSVACDVLNKIQKKKQQHLRANKVFSGVHFM